MMRCNLLSIDAWCDLGGGWTWNSWQTIEKDIVFVEEPTPRRVFNALRKWGYLTPESVGRLALDDDQYNLVIVDRNTYEPILALEYGCFEE